MSIAPTLGSPAFFSSLVVGLKQSNNALSASVVRLSTGNRITNVGDDVASFSVASTLQAQNIGYQQASSGLAQGSSLLQVAQGGLQQIGALLTSMQMIAQQADSSSLTGTQRGVLQEQFSNDFNEIQSIATSTSFNGVNLLNGALAGGVTFQSGATSSSNITVSIADSRTSALFSGTPNVSNKTNAALALTAIATASNTLQTTISNISGLQAAFNAAAGNLTQAIQGTASAVSNLTDTDIAAESTTFTQDTLKINAGIAVLAQAMNLPQNLMLLLRPQALAA